MSAVEPETLVDHIAELRRRLIWVLVIFLIAIVVTFIFVDPIYYALVNDASRLFPGMGEIELTVLGPGEILKVYFTVAGLAAFGLTIPFLLYHLWAFIKPALEEREAKLAYKFLPLVAGMFFAGILFGYYFVFPMLYKFLYQLGVDRFNIMYTAANYFGFMTNIVIPFGLIFEMPVAVLFLSRIGILAPHTLVKVRKYAYLALVIVASMISPPDLIAHLSVAGPMILLYELSIIIAKWSWKNREKAMQAAEARLAQEEA
ncbi:twin-arginine translocase subunit TatC [Tumebacillus avium]|uniref:Sec-independent protein translocase protein TatC n=1 Tax=Tumebacillus avium TaxID=1903704 RepID=A0A1Y0IP88_9BACL|nr:twin-arginine translocase subunit TatC [Tumebacillus avium]ARU61153.1 twin-arginine translocase subunit TatC [Tumebacillus avium]